MEARQQECIDWSTLPSNLNWIVLILTREEMCDSQPNLRLKGRERKARGRGLAIEIEGRALLSLKHGIVYLDFPAGSG